MKKVRSAASIAGCCVILAGIMAGELYADAPRASYQLPRNAQVIEYLLQSVNWYRHVYAERQVAGDTADLMFLDDNQAIEGQILKLSFDFAKADAALARTTFSERDASPPAPGDPPSDLAHFIDLKNQNDVVSQQAIQDIQTLNEKIGTAREDDRKKLKAALEDAQTRLELLRGVSQTVNDLIEFVKNTGMEQARTGTLDLTIDDLAASVPEMNGPAAPLTKLLLPDSKTKDGWRASGLLGLGSQLSAVDRKLRAVDEKIRFTDNLAICVKNVHTPLTGFVTRLLQSVATSDLQTSDLSSLRQQKSQLDALALEVKGLSPAIVALDKQKALLEQYKSHLLSWRTDVASQYREAWKKLVVRLLIILLIIGLLVGISELSRRLAFRRVQNPHRQRVISMVHRSITLVAIVVVAFFGIASDLSSLVTYFGLLSAGVAVALQNVIVASVGYLLLVGRRGIKIGDRIQVSGITGDVINMGLLQFQLNEFDLQKQKFTGHVATFSNSLVFVSPGIGLLKFSSAAEKATDA